jgi:dihydrofolate reductase
MSTVYASLGITLDGYLSGVGQSLEHPFGHIDPGVIHSWMFDEPEASEPVNVAARERIVDAGAFVMGRNMFASGRGEWDLDWTGWWGPNPPYHGPVFVLTHYERADLEMEGGTTFHFVTGGIEEALDRAKKAAGERDVSIAGGAATVNAYLAADLLDELRLHIAPVLIGKGERLFEGVGMRTLEQREVTHTGRVTHIRYAVRRA